MRVADLELLRASFKNNARNCAFYSYIFSEHVYSRDSFKDLLSRCFTSSHQDLSVLKYVFNEPHARKSKNDMKHTSDDEDLLVDSVRQILSSQ